MDTLWKLLKTYCKGNKKDQQMNDDQQIRFVNQMKGIEEQEKMNDVLYVLLDDRYMNVRNYN